MESTIDILRPNQGGRLATITFDTNSYRRWEVMGEQAITLNFSLPQIENGINTAFLEIPIGSYVEYKNRRYTLYNPSDLTKHSNRNYEYSIKLYAYQELMNDRIFINEPDGRQVFSRQARPEEFIEAIVRNMNHFDIGDWDGTEWITNLQTTRNSNIQRNIQFNGVSCMEALRLVAEAFKTEWEVNNKVISLRKVEYYKDQPLVMMYGGGQSRDTNTGGFIPGLGRGNFDQSRPVHKLYVKGGDRNIQFSTYGSQNLLLPKNATISFDGTYFEDETRFNSALARTYQTSADGTNLTRIDIPQTSRREAFIELTEAYPKFEGIITDVKYYYNNQAYTFYEEAVGAAIADGKDAGSVLIDVFDVTIPDELNFANMRVAGEELIMVPQTGRLAGREIGILQGDNNASAGYIHNERRFKLITDTDFGGFIPDDRLQIGDTYVLFGVNFSTPEFETYVHNGEMDLFKEAVRYKYENEELRFTFKGQMDGIWAQRNWDDINDRIVIGGYVNFTDPQFNPEGTLIRIAAIKEYLHEPYKPELELTNIVLGGGLRGELSEIPQQDIVIDETTRQSRVLEQRNWRNIMELSTQLGNVFTEFSEAINPVMVHSMQYLTGNKMGQFRFTTGINTNTVASAAPTIVYDAPTNKINIYGNSIGASAYIQHQTIGIESIDGKSASGDSGTLVRPVSEYRRWSVAPFEISGLEKDKLYWVYVRASKTSTIGTFLVETTARTEFEDANYYYLVVGALNSEHDGTRDFSRLFGFTEILPGQITTGVIRSEDGSYIDLAGGEFHIGNDTTYIDFTKSSSILQMTNATINMDNPQGYNMIHLDGIDGSGSLAGGNLSWDSQGNITGEDATFINVDISGSIRSPFIAAPSIWGDVTHTSMHILARGSDIDNSWTLFSLPSGPAEDGRRITAVCLGGVEFNAIFFENGISSSGKFRNEIVDIVYLYNDMYGSGRGWQVISKTRIGTGGKDGAPQSVLAQGFINGTTTNGVIRDNSTWPLNYLTFDNSRFQQVSRISQNRYQIWFPASWGTIPVNDYIVMLTQANGAGTLVPRIGTKYTNGFQFYFDEAGSCQFQIINIKQWKNRTISFSYIT